MQFLNYFPNPEKHKREQEMNPFNHITDYFDENRTVQLLLDYSNKDYESTLDIIPGLKKLIKDLHPGASKEEQLLLMEFLLHGLAEFSFLSKYPLETGIEFRDMMSSILTEADEEEDDDFRELRDII